jgi:hypothetical protein
MGDLSVIWICTFFDFEISRPPTRVSKTRPVPSQLSNNINLVFSQTGMLGLGAGRSGGYSC